MKVAAILAVAGAIVGEFLGSERGLGYLMLQVQVIHSEMPLVPIGEIRVDKVSAGR